MVFYPCVINTVSFLLRFSDETLAGIVGLEQDHTTPAVPGGDGVPAIPAVTTRRQIKPLDNADIFPETPGGVLLNCIEDIKVFLTNQVVKTFEKGGNATARYMGLLHRTVKKEFGSKFVLNQANWYHPKSTKDISATAANRSTKMTAYATHLSQASNNRFVSTAPLCGFPFKLDPLLCQMYDRKDLLESRFFPPNTHLDIHLTLKSNLGLALRSLAADDTDDQATRIALRGRNPSIVIDELYLMVDKVIFPEGHPFVESMVNKRRNTEALIWPISGFNELRDGIVPNQTEHMYRVNLTQLQFPAYIMISWMRQQQLEGSNGYNLNTSVYKFPPNMDSLDVTFAGSSLLPTGGPVTKMSSSRIDTMEKATLCRDQSLYFRRDPDALGEFYSEECVQQFIIIPLTHLYAHKPPSEWSTLSPILINMGFTADLSPTGWQIIVSSVTEGQLGMRADGSHFMLNAAGAKIDG